MERRYSFLVNMSILVDALEDAQIAVNMHAGQEDIRYSRVGFYHDQEHLDEHCIYIAQANHMPRLLSDKKQISLIVIGEPSSSYRYGNFAMITVQRNVDRFYLFDIISDCFEKNRRWDHRLQDIMNRGEGIESLMQAAYDYFGNPMFVHNPQFYILSCPVRHPDMTPLEWDEKAGLYMQSVELINSFKVDPVYHESLQTRGAQIYPKERLGYRILYVNLFNEFGRYVGRICIDELQTPLRKGHFTALEHLAGLVEVQLSRIAEIEESRISPFVKMAVDILEGRHVNEDTMIGMLSTQQWGIRDSYLCVKMELSSRDKNVRSIATTCNYIESEIDNSVAFQFDNNIVTIINMTRLNLPGKDPYNTIRLIVREGLFITGVSNEFHNFADLPYAMEQASIAHDYGKRINPMIWIHHYKDYVMDYVYDLACRDLPVRYIGSEKVFTLLEYDREHDSSLYNTLKCYVGNGLNAEQTARDLFLHRSTLFYRLRRIREISGISFEDQEEREYIRFTVNLLSHEEGMQKKITEEIERTV